MDPSILFLHIRATVFVTHTHSFLSTAHDIFWDNVGKSHKSLQFGKLLSRVLTILICFFWTIPVAFISTLAEVESLTSLLPFLKSVMDTLPWIGAVLEQLAPLMIILVNELLPLILGECSKLEGPISSSVLEVSLFAKLTAFMVSPSLLH